MAYVNKYGMTFVLDRQTGKPLLPVKETTIPSGQVTFVIKNNGAEAHNFDVNGVHSGAIIAPGATETWTVSLPAGQYLYTCDVPFHVDRGMTGNFTVTP